MSFQFNFANPNTDGDEDEETSVCNDTVDQQVLPCEEIIEEDYKKVEALIDTLKVLTYSVSNSVCIKCLDSQQVEQWMNENKSRHNTGTYRATQNHSDLIPNVYEGGLKVWECSVDLMEYLDRHGLCFKDKAILELGSGAGLPGILAMIKGAKSVHFQDYNSEVIESYTIPNVHINKTSSNHCHCRFFSGDWSHFKDNISSQNIKYDIILTAETIYKPENYKKLTSIFKEGLNRSGTIYLSAKSNYFGVGGGVCDFMAFLSKEDLFDVNICHTIEEAVPRQILKITWRQKEL